MAKSSSSLVGRPAVAQTVSIRRRYSANDVDAIAAYCPEIAQCYFLPIDHFADRTFIMLRLAPTRNNQRRGINWAEEYEFGATLGRHHGAVAQLGERRAGSAKATGSSPVGSMEVGAREIPRPVLFNL
jgi:hypothetical protein